MSTTFICQRCGAEYSFGITFTDVTFVGNRGRNLVAPCPSCGYEGDHAPADGIYSTVHGRLRRVADYLASSDPDHLARLKAEAEAAVAGSDVDRTLELLRTVGWEPPEKSRLSTANEAMDAILKLIAILGALLAGGNWTIDRVEQLVDRIF